LFRDKNANEVHMALTRGEISPDVPILTRVHEPFHGSDFFEFESSRHAYTVGEAMRVIATQGSGVIVLLRRGESAEDVLARFAFDTPQAKSRSQWDPRLFGIGAQILRQLNVRRMRVLSYPKNIPSMSGFDLEIVEFVPPADGQGEGKRGGKDRKLKAV
jgi:3,4-dihydroxy 2-butanone 4-phosphate synthase/GTP cyclohydrolase II